MSLENHAERDSSSCKGNLCNEAHFRHVKRAVHLVAGPSVPLVRGAEGVAARENRIPLEWRANIGEAWARHPESPFVSGPPEAQVERPRFLKKNS